MHIEKSYFPPISPQFCTSTGAIEEMQRNPGTIHMGVSNPGPEASPATATAVQQNQRAHSVSQVSFFSSPSPLGPGAF